MDLFLILSVFVTAVGFQLIIDIPHWKSNKSLENYMLTFPIKCSLSFQHFFLRDKQKISKRGKSKANYAWMSQTENTSILSKSTFSIVPFIRFPRAQHSKYTQQFTPMTTIHWNSEIKYKCPPQPVKTDWKSSNDQPLNSFHYLQLTITVTLNVAILAELEKTT